jgi:hypothetical protein
VEGLTPEILQEALQRHVKNCARKTGIEKSLAVRQGIEKVIYGKDNITVRFRWGLSTDGKEATGSFFRFRARPLRPARRSPSRKRKKARPPVGNGPSFSVRYGKNVELIGIEPTASSLRRTRSPS